MNIIFSHHHRHQTDNQKQKLCVLICYVLTSCLKQPQTQGFECLGCLHSCWSPLGTDGPQVTCNHTWPRKNSQLSMVNMVVRIHLAFWHREGLPLTMKSCFYPLIGDRIFGWPGDLVDILRCLQTSFCVQAFQPFRQFHITRCYLLAHQHGCSTWCCPCSVCKYFHY